MIWILLFLFSIQMTFAFLYRYRKPNVGVDEIKEWPAVSVLICGKNEAENIERNLPSILSQQFPKWEIVFVNDASSDESAEVLSRLQAKVSQLNVVNISPNAIRKFPGKKHALMEGLQATKHDIVLLTDADCKAASPFWITSMCAAYLQEKKQSIDDALFVLGYGAYQQSPGLLNRFVRWETVHTFIQYASWAKMGLPYMGVGRNLMYHKKAVLDLLSNNASFAKSFAETASGDDDLIISALANASNTIIVDNPESHTISTSPKDYSSWWKQKTRHVSSGKYYAAIVQIGLSLYAFSSFFFWACVPFMLVSSGPQIQIITLILVFLRLLAFWANAFRWNAVLGSKRQAWFYPLGEWMWLVYNMLVSPFIFWKNKQQWK